MKKLVVMAVMLVLAMGLVSACAEEELEDVLAPASELIEESVEVVAVETLISTDGYAVVLGTLVEQDSHHIIMKTNDNHDLDFKLAPETVIYAGDAEALMPGDEVAVVFEGELQGLSTDGVRVITISISAEEEDGLQEAE